MLYDTPDNQDIPSPSKAATNIDSNTDISKQLSLLDQHGSAVVRGDVQLIPIGDSILYVRPIYVETTEGATFPRFKYVAVTYGENSVLADSMPEGDQRALRRGHAPTATDRRRRHQPAAAATGTVAQLLDAGADEFDAADAALEEGRPRDVREGHRGRRGRRRRGDQGAQQGRRTPTTTTTTVDRPLADDDDHEPPPTSTTTTTAAARLSRRPALGAPARRVATPFGGRQTGLLLSP